MSIPSQFSIDGQNLPLSPTNLSSSSYTLINKNMTLSIVIFIIICYIICLLASILTTSVSKLSNSLNT